MHFLSTALTIAITSLLTTVSAHAEPYLGVFLGYGDASDAWAQTAGPDEPELSPEGIAVGGFAGFKHAFNGLVIGAEADVSFPDFSDAGDCSGVDCTVDVQVLSSLRGRAGVALGAVELYSVAGLALAVIQAETATSSDNTARTGWTLGAGIEYETKGLLRLGIEYRHTDYGEANIDLPAADDLDLRTDEVRLRLTLPLD